MEFETAYRRQMRNVFTVIFLFFMFMLAMLFINGVVPKRGQIVVELGEEVSTDLADYIDCVDFMRSLATLDLSEVDEDTPGTYQAVVTYCWRTFTYEIVIKDTTGPKIVMPHTTFYLEQGKTYEPEHFITEVSDVGGPVMLTIYGESEGQEKTESGKDICFDELGNNSFVLVATDIYGNVSDEIVWVYVDTPPVMNGVRDCYVALGAEPDFVNEVFVNDKVSGDVTGNVVVDAKNLDCSKEGDYEIAYYVEDDFGLSAEASCTVHVIPDDEIQRLIGAGEINSKDFYIARADDNFVVEEQIEAVKTSLVKINIGMDANYFTGNGFVVDITDEFVYIGTNRHVLNHEGDKELYFFDGTKLPFEIVELDESVDLGLVCVPVEDISKDTLSQLQSVKFDCEAWAKIDSERVPLFFCLMGKNGSEYKRTGYDLGYKTDYRKVTVPVLWVSMRLEPGNSGTALFDYDGNIIAIATGQSWYTNGDVHYYAVGARHMVDFYERVTGNDLTVK